MAGAGDGGVPHGRVLIEFVEACLQSGTGDLQATRSELIAKLGDAAFVDVCATVASFNAVVKLADATGIPLEVAKEERTRDFREELGIEAFRS